MKLACRATANEHIARLALRRILVANGQHVLALVRVHNGRSVFELKTQSSSKGERKEFVRHMDHLETAAAGSGSVPRHNVSAEGGAAVLQCGLGLWGGGNQVELFEVHRGILYGS